MMRASNTIPAVLAIAAVAALGGASASAQTYTLKLSTFSPPSAASSVLFKEYEKQLKEKSKGRLVLQIYYSASMGPMQRQYDLVRTGVADIAWMQHGATPGRFPLTELAHLPFTLPDPEIGAAVMMDLLPKYLAKEHRGVKVLYFALSPTDDVYTAGKEIRNIKDIKLLRLRAGTTTIAELLKDVGAAPIGIAPNLMAEGLQKGTLDGIVTGPTGVFSFKLGNLLKYRTRAFDAMLTFGLVMNPDAYKKLPRDLQALIDEIGSKAGAIDAAQKVWNSEKSYEKYITESGIKRLELDAASKSDMRRFAEKLAQRRIAALEKKGLPARAMFDAMKAAVAKYEKK